MVSSLGSMSEFNGKRVVVTGMAGAGKSNFSRALSAKTGLPVIHLDLYSWNPGWERVSNDEMLQKQRGLLSADTWIVDSNDVDEEVLVNRADTLVILATPWWICSWRAFRRGLQRPSDMQLPEGCEESLSQRLRDEWAIVFRNWRNRATVTNRDMSLASRCPASIHVLVMRSKQEIDRFIGCL